MKACNEGQTMVKRLCGYLWLIQAAVVEGYADVGFLAEPAALAEVDHCPAARDLIHH